MKNISSLLKDININFERGFGIIDSCEESFLPLLHTYAQDISGLKVGIKVIKDLDSYIQRQGAQNSITVVIGKELDIESLPDAGFNRVERVWEKGEYSLLGDVIVIWPLGEDSPIRISLFDSLVEEISYINPDTRQKISTVKSFQLKNDDNVIHTLGEEDSDINLVYIKGLSRFTISNSTYPVYSVGAKAIPNLDYSDFKTIWAKTLGIYRKQGYKAVYLGDIQDNVIKEVGFDFDYIFPKPDLTTHGFIIPSSKFVFVTQSDLLGEIDITSLSKGKVIAGDDIFKKFAIGDYIVHEDHGIGVFNGITEREQGSYIEIGYAGKDRLLIPFTQFSKLSKYVGAGKRIPTLTGLNSGIWKRVKKGVEEDVLAIAKELVQMYAIRSISKVPPIINDYADEQAFWKFVESFEFADTEDQYVISNQLVEDFKGGDPMDRLVVGDVGFGKTEIAMRAAFAVLNAGFQVAFLAPTTILSHQHYKNALKRFSDYPFTIAELSRLVDSADKDVAIEKIKKGAVDLVIGTHSLLSDRVAFNRLGLIIIDEEQRFGVKQKEALKEKRAQSHVLSLTATPIPRTLSLALNGVREMSILASVPQDRKPIKNWFGEFDWDRVVSAIMTEKDRDGQVYYLHNKISELDDIKAKLEGLIPGLKVAVVYGQMYKNKLNRLMSDFIDRKYDVLLSTTIIENGLDLPNVNTLIVDDSDRYGLSQLYQIRGRIGRSKAQAFAYFMYQRLRGDSELRLDALKESEGLGSGFLLSNRDLEIRGSGNILGKEQSGVINSVGYGLYTKMLKEAVDALRLRYK
ncbi:MAG TPA: CarD family transcriptional regulator [Candidatus Dojkabacteria bacterium]|nr:CarD family transcriptional regulator [Candidatus Dojkabacteria bacterium]